MRQIVLAASALVASFAIAGCSDQAGTDPGPNAESNKPSEANKKDYVSGMDNFAKQLADKQARDKNKTGKK